MSTSIFDDLSGSVEFPEERRLIYSQLTKIDDIEAALEAFPDDRALILNSIREIDFTDGKSLSELEDDLWITRRDFLKSQYAPGNRVTLDEYVQQMNQIKPVGYYAEQLKNFPKLQEARIFCRIESIDLAYFESKHDISDPKEIEKDYAGFYALLRNPAVRHLSVVDFDIEDLEYDPQILFDGIRARFRSFRTDFTLHFPGVQFKLSNYQRKAVHMWRYHDGTLEIELVSRYVRYYDQPRGDDMGRRSVLNLARNSQLPVYTVITRDIFEFLLQTSNSNSRLYHSEKERGQDETVRAKLARELLGRKNRIAFFYPQLQTLISTSGVGRYLARIYNADHGNPEYDQVDDPESRNYRWFVRYFISLIPQSVTEILLDDDQTGLPLFISDPRNQANQIPHMQAGHNLLIAGHLENRILGMRPEVADDLINRLNRMRRDDRLPELILTQITKFELPIDEDELPIWQDIFPNVVDFNIGVQEENEYDEHDEEQ